MRASGQVATAAIALTRTSAAEVHAVSGLTVGGFSGGDSSHLRHRDLETVRRRLVRLAFDIHDGPLQSLAAAGFGLKDLHSRVSALLADTPERDTAGKLIVELIDELSETE